MEKQSRAMGGTASGRALMFDMLRGLRTRMWRLPRRNADLMRTAAALQESERELAEKSRLLQTALDHIEHGIQMIDAQGRIVVINRKAIELMGVPEQIVTGNPLITDVAKWQRANGQIDALPDETYRRMLEGGHVARYQRRRPDGSMLEVRRIDLPGGGHVRTHTDITEWYEAQTKAAFLARHDSLTSLANRGLFQDRLDEALATTSRLAVLLVDLDRFKEVNDTLGHPVGDELLKAVAERLRNAVRDGSTVARLGGDEFALILARLQSAADAETIALRIIDTVGKPYDIEGNQIVIGVSIGIAVAMAAQGHEPAPEPMNRDVLLRQADLALYQAKADGRGTSCFFSPDMEQRLISRRRVESDLRQALTDDTFELYYQPLVDLRSGLVSGFEALLRWRHPERGLLSAGDFVPIAEATGLIIPIGEWALRRACQDAAAWPDHTRVSVNLSPVQFRSPTLVNTVREAVGVRGMSPSRLELEITETVLMLNSEHTTATLQELRALGAGIALDDFGTGYSSLSYVRSFPFDTIKIDKTFVDGIGLRRDCDAIVRAVTRLAYDLNIRSLAEGVESAAQLDRVRAEGCNEAQGYFFSQPRPAADVPDMMSAIRRIAATCLPELF